MKICILGAGALGSAIGGTLAASGADVTLVSRTQAHVDAINRDGLTLVSGNGETTVKVKAATTCRGLTLADLVIVLVKSFATREAVASVMPIVTPDTVVMSLQNGLGHEDIVSAVVGRERTMAGKTYVGGVYLAPGRVIAGTQDKLTVIGELDGCVSARALAIAAIFETAGLRCQVSDNIVGTMWDKLLINVSTGAISGVTGLAYGPLYGVSECEATGIAAVEEAMAVARAAGVGLSIATAREAWLMAAAGLPDEFKTSMLQSLERGSVTEIDYINGAVVRGGKRYGVPTPVNATLVACIKGVERRLQETAKGAVQ